MHDLPWYGIRVRSNFEFKSAAALAHKGFEQFIPSYKMRRRWSDRYKVVSPLAS
jgi:hypothetical protein